MKPSTKRLSGVIAVAIAAIALKRERVIAPAFENSKVIFLGPGCGHVAYTMGFVDTMIRDDVIRGAIVDSGAVFGGTSSGALAAGFAMASLNGVGTMEEWYQTEVRKGFEAIQKHSTMIMGEVLLDSTRRYYAACLNATLKRKRQQLLPSISANNAVVQGDGADQLIPWLQTFPVSLTELSTLKPVFVSQFSSAESFTAVMQASSFVPGVMGLEPWLVVDDGNDGDDEVNPGLENNRTTPKSEQVDATATKSSNTSHSSSSSSSSSNSNSNSSSSSSSSKSSSSKRRVFDGFLGTWSTAWPSSYMYVGFLNTYPAPLLGSASYLRAFEFDSTGGGLTGFVTKAWPWGDPAWADEAFKRGQSDAKSGRDELRSEMCKFLGGCNKQGSNEARGG